MPDLVFFAIPAFIILLVAEAVFSAVDDRELFDTRDTLASLAMGVGNVLVNLSMKAIVLAALLAVYRYRIFEIGFAWWVWPVAFVADDFSYYWFHRVSHACRFFWASHVIHHSSQRYNLSTALRQTWTGNVTGTFLFWAWMPLLGFHPLVIMTLKSISLIYQFWIHTETIRRLPAAVEWVFNTPSHHRVHHGADVKYLDRNHGGILILWDRLFGTFQVEEQRPRYGLRRDIETYNPFRIAFHEWADLLADAARPNPLSVRLRYVFGPPGWSPDGSSLTARELREAVAGDA